MSSPPRAPFDVQVLCMVEHLLGLIHTADQLSRDGDNTRAAATFGTIVGLSADLRPVVKGVISAKRQAAEMADASERTVSTVARVLRRQAQEHPHVANDETHTATTTQPEPAA